MKKSASRADVSANQFEREALFCFPRLNLSMGFGRLLPLKVRGVCRCLICHQKPFLAFVARNAPFLFYGLAKLWEKTIRACARARASSKSLIFPFPRFGVRARARARARNAHEIPPPCLQTAFFGCLPSLQIAAFLGFGEVRKSHFAHAVPVGLDEFGCRSFGRLFFCP